MQNNPQEGAQGKEQSQPLGKVAGGMQYEQVVLKEAYENITEQKYEAAAQIFEDVLKRFAIVLERDQRSLIASETAQIYLWLGDYERAYFHAEASLGANGGNEQALEILGKIAVAEYKFPSARGYFSRISEENPAKHLGLCFVALRLRDKLGAMHFIQEAAKYAPRTDPEYRILAAYCQLLSGYSKEAVSSVREVVKEIDKNPWLILIAGEIYMMAGNYGEAEAMAKKVQKHCPKNDQAFAILAHTSYVDEEYDSAEDYAMQAISQNPRNAYAVTVLMKCATRIGNYARAERLGTDILENAPEYSLAHANLGDVYFIEGQYGLAQIEYEQTMGLMTADTKGSRLRSARMKFIAGEYQQAVEILKKLILEHHTYFDDAMCDLALCYDKIGDVEKKEEIIEQMEIRRSFYHRTEKLLEAFEEEKR